MEIDPPEGSSTPTPVPHVKGRRGVHHGNLTESPIAHSEGSYWCDHLKYSQIPEAQLFKFSPPLTRRELSSNHDLRDNSGTESDYSNEDSPQISSNSSHFNQSTSLHSQHNSSQTKTGFYKNYKSFIPTVGLFLFIIMMSYMFGGGNPKPNKTSREELISTLKHVEGQFTHQEEDFWRKIRLNIEEIQDKNKPSSIVFLYENSRNGKSTMQHILNNVTRVAICHLTDCDNNPIEIKGSVLNSGEIIADYGKVISQYKDPLKDSGVMIVEHLEEIRGNVAQAFHYFCDEYEPIVRNALLLFTVEVDKLPNDGKSDSYLRNTLRILWNDIGRDDKFDPLYARISATILVVRPE